MNSVFADAGFYIALLNPGDQHAVAARTFMSDYAGQIVTSVPVLMEVGNFLSTPRMRPQFVNLMQVLQQSQRVTIVELELPLWQRGLQLYASRPDKGWSLTDCLSLSSSCRICNYRRLLPQIITTSRQAFASYCRIALVSLKFFLA